MPRIKWDQISEKLYEVGVDQGVLYKMDGSSYGTGVAWNGLTAFNDSPEGGEPNEQWADNILYAQIMGAEKFKATVEAFTYPDEFAECDGSAEIIPGVFAGQQTRVPFGFVCRTKVGNDTEGQDHGYKIHICYGCQASPSEKNYETINDSPDAITFSWDFTGTPVEVSGYKPTAHLVVDSTKFTTQAQKDALAEFEDVLFGTDGEGSAQGTDATLPLPDRIVELLTVT